MDVTIQRLKYFGINQLIYFFINTNTIEQFKQMMGTKYVKENEVDFCKAGVTALHIKLPSPDHSGDHMCNSPPVNDKLLTGILSSAVISHDTWSVALYIKM